MSPLSAVSFVIVFQVKSLLGAISQFMLSFHGMKLDYCVLFFLNHEVPAALETPVFAVGNGRPHLDKAACGAGHLLQAPPQSEP